MSNSTDISDEKLDQLIKIQWEKFKLDEKLGLYSRLFDDSFIEFQFIKLLRGVKKRIPFIMETFEIIENDGKTPEDLIHIFENNKKLRYEWIIKEIIRVFNSSDKEEQENFISELLNNRFKIQNHLDNIP